MKIITISFVAAMICLLFRSWLLAVSKGIDEFFGSWHWLFPALVSLVIVIGTIYLLKWLGGFRWKDFFSASSIYFPPNWFAVPLGAVFFYGALAGLHRSSESNVLFPICLFTTLGLFLLFLVSVFLSKVRFLFCYPREILTADVPNKAGGQITLLQEPARLLDWIKQEQPIEKPEEDYFSLSITARRIASLLQRSPFSTIGLIGPYGCGKSSVLKLVRFYLNHPCYLNEYLPSDQNSNWRHFRRIMTCQVSSWGFREGSAIEHILGTMIKTLADNIDCLGLMAVPSAYRMTISGLNNSWGKVVGNLLTLRHTPEGILECVDKALACADLRLVVILEDIDRNTEEQIFLNEVASLLDHLKNLENITFVLAIGEEYHAAEILVRTCEHIDTIPHLPYKEVFGVVKSFRQFCLAAFPDDIPVQFAQRLDDRLGIKEYYIHDFLYAVFDDPKGAFENMIRLMRTPRILKTALRRTWHAWEKVHGELDYDDLLVENVLRIGDPESFAFILTHENQLRLLHGGGSESSSERISKLRDSLHEKWNTQMANVAWNRDAAFELLDFLFPGWSDWESDAQGSISFQGVANSSQINYWINYQTRLLAEEIPPSEIRDQNVLHAIQGWKSDREAKVYEKMSLDEAIYHIDGLAARIEHFGFLLDGSEVRELADMIFDLCQGEKKNQTSHETCPGFNELWRLAMKQPVSDHSRWLQDEIRKTLPVSLKMAQDLFYFWGSDDAGGPMLEPEVRREVRRQMQQDAQKAFMDDANSFLNVLSPRDLFGTANLVDPFNVDKTENGFVPENWQWLTQILVRAGEINPQLVIPQIVGLLVETHIGVTSFGRAFQNRF